MHIGLTDITTALAKKSFQLGFGKAPIKKSTLSKVNNLRDYRIFEEFAFHMVFLAKKRSSSRLEDEENPNDGQLEMEFIHD